MSNNNESASRRPLRFWLGLLLGIFGASAALISGGAFLSSRGNSEILLKQLMEPLEINLIESGVSSNIVARLIVGEKPSAPELEQLTPRQQRTIDDVLVVRESQRQISENYRKSTSTGAGISLTFSTLLTALGLWLMRTPSNTPTE
jgi:hypothetical protein